MNLDVLSDILNHTRLKSSIYFKADFSAPWGMDIPKGSFAQFHLIVRGQCLLRTRNHSKSLFAGDIVVFPNGTSHWLADSANSNRSSGLEIVRSIAAGKSYVQNDSIATTLLCGHFELDENLNHPFLRELPDIIHLADSEIKRFTWLKGITSLIIEEMDFDMAGQNLIINRLGEILFIQVLRAYIEQNKSDKGFVAALKDKRIRNVLGFIHNNIEKSYSLGELAQKAGMSRTSFFNLFKELVGVTPKRYSVNLKITKSKELLKHTEKNVAEICQMVGYNSESSYSKAFKANTSLTPMEYRKEKRM
ncbi:MAG: AraC family transcriptional regulator [Saonia sp.]